MVGGAAQFDDVTFTGPSVTPTYPGTGEDLRLSSAVGGASPTSGPGIDVKTAFAGDLLEFNVSSPNSTYTLQNYYLVGTIFAQGAPPVPQFPLLGLWVDLPSHFIMVGALTPMGYTLIAPNGSSTFWRAPAGFPGLALMVQALSISPSAANGIYASADAHEIQFQ